jgi:D-amino-acid dehydrogenase
MKQSEFIVLGAGIVGVSTALALQARGHRVVLIDRQEPGLGASYGNSGVIQREAVEPYAFPRNISTLLGAATGSENAIHYHANALFGLLKPLATYWRNSAPEHYLRIAREYSSLIAHSVSEHAPLIASADAQELIRKEGWYQAFRTPSSQAAAAATAQRLHDAHGLAYRAISADELLQAAPSLKKDVFAGAILWQDPWTVSDPNALVRRYAELFVSRGGDIAQTDASTLKPAGAGWRVGHGASMVTAENAVVALGAWSDVVLKPLGYDFPLFIKRGYHRHFKTPQPFMISMLDPAKGLMLAPMRSGLRITTGAEFAKLDAPATPVQIKRSEAYVREILDLGDAVETEPWLGARPCTADMKPVVGPGYLHRGLWFNLGHGHQGLTLGPATARLLAEQVDNETTFIDKAPFLPSRFRT